MNLNISDQFFEAIEEYNISIKKFVNCRRHLLQNYEYKRGMLFTCLRRHFNIFKRITRNYPIDIKVEDINCVFNDDHTIKSIIINKTAPFNISWDNNGEDKAIILSKLKKITDIHKTIYPTKELNGLAQIFNQM